MVSRRHLAASALAALCAAGAPSARAACGWSGYSYAGVRANDAVAGIAATLTELRPARVERGHVAAWIGIGGFGAGPHGTDAWLQVGLAVRRGGGRAQLFWELKQPRYRARIVMAPIAARPGRPIRVAVIEMRPGVWRVWANGRPLTVPVYLPGSHDTWRPVATAENWDGGVRGCNGFSFRFSDVRVVEYPGARWQRLVATHPLETPGYRIRMHWPAAFTATSD
jgi:hypothetical protein